MPDIFAALPTRPLHARPPASIMNAFWGVVGLMFVVAALGYLLLWVAPDIATDWQIRQNAALVRNAGVSDGRCGGKLFVSICDVTLSAPVSGRTVVRRVHYVFGSFESGDITVAVVADPAHPEWLTTDQALETFWNRVLSLVLAFALMLALAVAGVVGSLRARRIRRSWMRASAVAVPLQLIGSQAIRGGFVWTVKSDTGLTQRWTLPRKAKPYVLGPGTRILGLATRGGGAIMPLDAGLRWVDLSPEERRSALAAQPPLDYGSRR